MAGGWSRRAAPRRLCAWLALAGLVAGVSSAAAESVDPWSKGRQWLTVRAGYARSAADGAADGNFGVGFGYLRMRNSKWSFGANAQVDVLGRYGGATEIGAPWMLEVVRHYRWSDAMRPFAGVGGGAYYHKIQGTTMDFASVQPSMFVTWGANALVSDRGLLGLDVRANLVEVDYESNPVFGSLATTGKDQSRAFHWSAKLGYSWAF